MWSSSTSCNIISCGFGERFTRFRIEDIGITSSLDILRAIAKNEGPGHALVTLGYAGWGAGQLEQEMAENAWLSGPADPSILFHTPDEERWRAAAASLGVDLNRLSGDTGHA